MGNVSRVQSSQLVPSGALHPPAFKQARSAAALSFTRSGVLGRAAVWPPPQCSAQQLVGGSSLHIKDVVWLWIIFHRTLRSDELKAFIRKTSVTTTKPAKNKTQKPNHSGTHTSFQTFNYKINAYDRHQQAYRKIPASVFNAASINISRFQMDALQ